MQDSLIERLRRRAMIRRGASSRKSVQEGKPDRISDLLEEAASCLEDTNKTSIQCCSEIVRDVFREGDVAISYEAMDLIQQRFKELYAR